jgi:hypothetical protein
MTANTASITKAELSDAWTHYHATLDEMRKLMEATPATSRHRSTVPRPTTP